MFTGIIEDVDIVKALITSGAGIRLLIKTDKLDMSDVCLGDSIANNEVCLTVVAMSKSGFSADTSHKVDLALTHHMRPLNAMYLPAIKQTAG